MEKRKVLIVSDSPDRKAFLEFHVKAFHLYPVWYPNILAARSDPFSMVIVDLSIPIEPKLALIGDCLESQRGAIVISIGKMECLKKESPLQESDSIVTLSSIESVPEFMKEWLKKDS